MDNKYLNKHYHLSVSDDCDVIAVSKYAGNEWCAVKMITNGEDNGKITIRSKEMAEQLQFMLGQMLSN